MYHNRIPSHRRVINVRPQHPKVKEIAVSPAAEEGVQLPGFTHITRKGNSTKTKTFWAIICLFVVAGCLYQICERIYYFYTCKPVMNTKLVTRDAIPFPVVVACPCDEEYKHPAVDQALLKELHGNVSYKTVYELMDATQMDIKTLWNISRIVVNYTYFTLSDGLKLATGFDEKSDMVEDSEILTTSGTCFLVRAKQDVQHDGFYTYIGMEGFRKELYNATPAYYQVHLLNTWSMPCDDGMKITQCLVECVENEIFSKVRKPCRLPYMKAVSKIPECTSSQEFRDLYDATAQVVHRFRREQCKSCNLRQCKEFIYHFESLTEKVEDNIFLKVWVRIPVNRFPFTQEESIYSLVALFTDIASGLGFFIGICALQIVELLVGVFNVIGRRFQF